MTTRDFETRTKALIDKLKTTCASAGLGNDGNEFKIITQVFLYKFLNDKFAFELKKLSPEIAQAENWEVAARELPADDYDMLLLQLGSDTAKLRPRHFIATLFDQQNEPDFSKRFDDTLFDIAATNADIFAVKTAGGAKVSLFDRISEFIHDERERDDFCRAIINTLVTFSFEHIFVQKYDFYATIFEYPSKTTTATAAANMPNTIPPMPLPRLWPPS